MGKVIIGLGSNLGDRQKTLQNAGIFLGGMSAVPLVKSSLYETEPVGIADQPFLNAAVQIETALEPGELLKQLKQYEKSVGRDPAAPRWSNRPLDLDIIAYDSLQWNRDGLVIPHPEYHNRLFVLIPLQEIHPDWADPVSGKTISEMISSAPELSIFKKAVKW